MVPNLFPVLQMKETPEILARGRLKTIGYMITFLVLLIGLTVFYATQQTVIEKSVQSPTYQDYINELEEWDPTCPCTVATATLSQFASISMVQDTFCSSATSVFDACVNDDVCDSSSTSNIFFGMVQLCNVASDLIAARIESFNETTYVTPNLITTEEFNDTIHSVAEASARELGFTMLASTDITESLSAINSPIYWSKISVRNDTNINGADASDIFPYQNSSQHNCAKVWIPSECSQYYNVETMKLSEVASESWWQSQMSSMFPGTTLTAAQLTFNTTYPLNMNYTIGELVKIGFIKPVGVTTKHETHFQACAPAKCTYTRSGTRNVAEILTAIAGLIGGLNAILKGCFGALPTGEGKKEGEGTMDTAKVANDIVDQDVQA